MIALATALFAVHVVAARPRPRPAAPPPPAVSPVVQEAMTLVRVQRQTGFGALDLAIAAPAVQRDPTEAVANAAIDEAVRVVGVLNAGVDAINATPIGTPVVVEPELFSVLMQLVRVARLSRGAYDPVVTAFPDDWHEPAVDAAAPAPRARRGRGPMKPLTVDQQKLLVSFEALALDAAARTVTLQRAAMALDVNDVAPAYALDRARVFLTDKGFANFILSVGGDVLVVGNRGGVPGGEPFMVGLQDPRGDGAFLVTAVSDGLGPAVMTTNDNADAFVVSGERFHGVLDPRTGQPGKKARSVSVFGDDALTAKAWSQAVFILGDKDGLRLMSGAGAEAVVVTGDNRVVMSRGMQTRAKAGILKQRPPSDGE